MFRTMTLTAVSDNDLDGRSRISPNTVAMSILTRYVLSETTRVLLTTTTVITLVMLPLGVGREALDHGLPVGCTLQLLPYLLPEALRVGLPVAVLLAVVMTFSRLSGFNELLAVKAAGIPPYTVIGPVLALAFAVSLFTVWMNDLAASWGRDGVQRVVVGRCRADRFEHAA